MPRSVNQYLQRKRRKILKKAVISEEEKMFIQLLKMRLKRVLATHTEIEKIRKEYLDHYGLRELMLQQESMVLAILNLLIN